MLALSFALVGGTTPEGLLFFAVPGLVCLMAGINVCNRHPSGWTMSVFIFGMELAMVLSANFATAIHLLIDGGPSEAIGSTIRNMLVPSLLTALPLLYLVRPKVKSQFWL